MPQPVWHPADQQDLTRDRARDRAPASPRLPVGAALLTIAVLSAVLWLIVWSVARLLF